MGLSFFRFFCFQFLKIQIPLDWIFFGKRSFPEDQTRHLVRLVEAEYLF